MIEILPMQDQQRENQILKTLQEKALLEKGDKGRVLLMTERGSELGMVSLAVRGSKLMIFEFTLANPCDFEKLDEEQSFFVDTLMRSAASFGETNGASGIHTANNLYNSFLQTKGFETDENHAFTKMSTIVHYT